MSILERVKCAKNASISLGAISSEMKNTVLSAIATELAEQASAIAKANLIDMAQAREANLPAPLLKRLAFDEAKIKGVIDGIHSLINLPDPVGNVLSATELDEGLTLTKVTCPIGVIGIIFESRPDALVQISTLCLKSGNAAVLKGGSEALNTNRELARVICEASEKAGLKSDWLQLIETREDVREMLKMDGLIDLIIPRGSNAFVKYIMDNSNIPVLGHADGICHVFIDQTADIQMACNIAIDSKCQYVSVCNAMETLLVHQAIAPRLLPTLCEKYKERGTRLLGCERTRAIVPMEPATEKDWDTEYLDNVLSIRIVDDLAAAIDHINTHGSGHTDVIVTQDAAAAETFMNLVDSGDVFWNCSSRFADGFRFGLGAEVGISTNKIHARGPVGLEGLVIYKWHLAGHGQIVADYAEGRKHFTHKKLK
ncbi:MAG: glutamate-5-semialdehyde dehydrogenase [Victivallales bacterium]|nr:glutamate-5-semialdehyde dehydrogenase [Victivallales bacterium]